METYQVFQTDILVAGSGIAGLMAAYTAAASPEAPKVTVITKNIGCASNHVLGFNAPVGETDSPKLYAEDTLQGGGYINRRELVRVLAEHAAGEVEQMEALGMAFDESLLKPLGCSVPRLVHCGNHTGRDTVRIYRKLLEEKQIPVLEGVTLVDVIVEEGRVKGAVVFLQEPKRLAVILASAVILATGGIHIAEGSTYPEFMTGDGYGIAYRAGARLTDMEFIQFEPCRCIYPQKLGISTTLLTSGGVLRNRLGERFLLEDYPNEGSVPKDALARLIALEVQKGNGSEHGGVYLDLTSIPREILVKDHQLYYERFMNAGIDLTTTIVEVGPCAHSFMGGICIDEACRTGVAGLYAAGEVAGGIHGANRVGGNAGTEIYVFGRIAGEQAAQYIKEFGARRKQAEAEQAAGDREKIMVNVELWSQNILRTYTCSGTATEEEYRKLRREVLRLMQEFMGPVRRESGILQACSGMEQIGVSLNRLQPADVPAMMEYQGVRNLLTVCRCSCDSALRRKESRGAHYRMDYPERRSEYASNYICEEVRNETESEGNLCECGRTEAGSGENCRNLQELL